MGDIIKLKKGLKANRPALALSELTSDNDAGNERLIYGGINGSVEFPNMKDIDKLTSNLTDIVQYNVKNFGAKGNGTNDDTVSIQNAINAIKLNGGGSLYFPNGTYLVTNSIMICSNLKMYGDKKSIITGAIDLIRNFVAGEGDSNINNNMKNIEIYNLIFKSTSIVFSEFVHLITMSFVSNIKIHDCSFIGWQGDALAFGGSADVYGAIRHNTDVHIWNCEFDGINGDNRQAITFTDIDGCLIESCNFKNTTRSNMPGAIDFEPNSLPIESIIKNATVRNCTFENIGGMAGAITLYLPNAQETMTTASENINVIGNTFKSCRNMFLFSQPVSTKDITNKIIVNNNTSDKCYPFEVFGVSGIEISNNTFKYSSGNANLGGSLSDGLKLARHIVLKGNIFDGMGRLTSQAIALFSCDDLIISKNIFKDCGVQTQSTGYGISVASVARLTNTKIIENVFKNDFTTAMLYSIVAQPSVTLVNFEYANNTHESGITEHILAIWNRGEIKSYERNDLTGNSPPSAFSNGTTYTHCNLTVGIPNDVTNGLGLMVTSKQIGASTLYTNHLIAQIIYPNNPANKFIYKRFGTYGVDVWDAWCKILSA
ncbi:glycoside hydrolase family 55 protein [Clostridium tagluense]|uniref:glycoside hydrolase family 55 protein n=1 Tax=Clostridium tagluense TaxID=360422 RepID=UPI001CF300EF|nr:glycoside hydrolase family 55 protein [Clostridium tagluense]MCB2300662.1 glycoside hydrolase family 55 protein [Clostridium tagluense]